MSDPPGLETKRTCELNRGRVAEVGRGVNRGRWGRAPFKRSARVSDRLNMTQSFVELKTNLRVFSNRCEITTTKQIGRLGNSKSWMRNKNET